MTKDPQPRFTDEDIFSPVYCRHCHEHTPRTVIAQYHGFCLVCISAIYYADTMIGRCRECNSTNLHQARMTVTCNYCGHRCSTSEMRLARLKGQTLHNRQEWIDQVRPILFEVDSAIGVEAHVSILLGPKNDVRETIFDIGTWDHVTFSIDNIVAAANAVEATKIIMAHNHPRPFSSTPSDLDVETAARLLGYLGHRGIQIVDDLVVCRGSSGPELKSVMNTRRFKDQIRGY